jgi:nucleoside-diphosphate-sugar epimerase
MINASQKILVTGGAGFIGSHTIDLLLSLGHHITVLDNLSTGKLTNLDLNHPQLVFIEGDICDFSLVKELVDGKDQVLHLAAISSVPLSIEDPIYTFQINTQGFLHVLLAVRALKKQPRLVYASSASVYGNLGEMPCLSDKPLSPMHTLSPYALQKIHAEHYADLFSRLDQLNCLGLRYFNVYGTRQDPHSPYSGVISRFIDAYQKGSDLTIYGNGLQSRDFIYVKDVALANALALKSNYNGVLNIATGVPETLLQLVLYLQTIGDTRANVKFEDARLGDIQSSFGDTKRTRDLLGFSYQISLKEGLKMMMTNSTDKMGDLCKT